MLTGAVNNTLIKSIGGFLGCYPVKEYVDNGRSMYIINIIYFFRVKKMIFVYSLPFKLL